MIKKNTFLTARLLLIAALLSLALNVKSMSATSGVDILSQSSYLSSTGSLHIVGEVRNSGSVAVTSVEIIATLYDSTNKVVGTDFTFSTLNIIPPGEKSPFEILFINETQVPKVDHFSLSVSFLASSPLLQGLQIISNSSYFSQTGALYITGVIKNFGGIETKYVEVIATCYDIAGKVVLTDSTFSEPINITPGQIAEFEIVFTENNRVPMIARYTLTAQSTEYSTIPEYPSLAVIAFLLMISLMGVLIFKRRPSKQQALRRFDNI